ncbi:MAG: flagellar hook-basal body protein [bacterium]|nr:flagellar hook-basal body protein [bacterium]
MVRSLWSAATGMIAQQLNVDTIAHNLSNVNTTGYKTDVAEFQSLLYQTLQTRTTSANGEEKPGSAQVGLGVRNSSISSIFTQGEMRESTSPTAFAIEGEGFFSIRGLDGGTYYTRNGNFFISEGNDGLTLCTAEGYPVLDTEGDEIVFDPDMIVSKITITDQGSFCYPDETNNPQELGMTIGVYQFNNPTGLYKTDGGYYQETPASGEAMNEAENDALKKSKIVQGYLEASNVKVVDEMVNLIIAQRAYEMNSKAITTTDEMMQTANQLKS